MTDAADRLTPPGFYVGPEEDWGLCRHCGVFRQAHRDALRYCPALPLALQSPPAHDDA